MFRRPSRSKAKRVKLRSVLFPGSEKYCWPQPEEVGWTRMPRGICLLLRILDHNTKGKDVARTYLDLLSRNYDEGLVEIIDEREHAKMAGFSDNPRGVRSWHERLQLLEQAGFIRLSRSGNRLTQVLLVHPRKAVKELRRRDKNSISEALWTEFVTMLVDLYPDSQDTEEPLEGERLPELEAARATVTVEGPVMVEAAPASTTQGAVALPLPVLGRKRRTKSAPDLVSSLTSAPSDRKD